MAATVATTPAVRRIDIPEAEWNVRDGFGKVVSRVTAASASDAQRSAARDSPPRTRRRKFTVVDTGCLLRATVDASTFAAIVGTDTWELPEQHLAASCPGAALGHVAARCSEFRAHADRVLPSRAIEAATGYAPCDVAVPDATVPAAEDQAR